MDLLSHPPAPVSPGGRDRGKSFVKSFQKVGWLVELPHQWLAAVAQFSTCQSQKAVVASSWPVTFLPSHFAKPPQDEGSNQFPVSPAPRSRLREPAFQPVPRFGRVRDL